MNDGGKEESYDHSNITISTEHLEKKISHLSFVVKTFEVNDLNYVA